MKKLLSALSAMAAGLAVLVGCGPNQTVEIAVVGVELSETTLHLNVGESAVLQATVTPENATDKSLEWTSTEPEVALVQNGTVRAVGLGQAIVSATSKNGKVGSCTVLVQEDKPSSVAVTGIRLSATSLTIAVGESAQLTATVSPSNATVKGLKWYSESDLVSVDPNGNVYGVKVGTAIVTVEATDGSGVKATCTVTVYDPEDGKIHITFNPSEVEMEEDPDGKSGPVTVDVRVEPKDAEVDNYLRWDSSDWSVVAFELEPVRNPDGSPTGQFILQLFPEGPGSAFITVSDPEGNVLASLSVTVKPVPVKVATLRIDPSSAVLKVGGKVTMTAVYEPADAANAEFVWSSSRTSVASLNKDKGISVEVTALDPGSSTITVSTADGSLKATAQVTVSPKGIDANGFSYVDMGLSVYLAYENVGAEKNHYYEAGDYFAWGETKPQADYSFSWNSYKWWSPTEGGLTKYCTESSAGKVDNLTQLLPEDDAAHVNMGGDWRMPTAEEAVELVENCDISYRTFGSYRLVRFTSKRNSAILEIPVAGGYSEGYYLNGENFLIWTSTLSPIDSEGAMTLQNYRSEYVYGFFRSEGFNVRGVLSKE